MGIFTLPPKPPRADLDIESYLKSGDTVFFAVGAAHMLGDGGLVKLLTDKGYEVTRMDPPYLITKDA